MIEEGIEASVRVRDVAATLLPLSCNIAAVELCRPSVQAHCCWRYSSRAEAWESNHQLQSDVPVNDVISAPRLLVAAHFVWSSASSGALLFLDILGRGLGNAAVILAFVLVCRRRPREGIVVLALTGRMTVGTLGCAKATSAVGRRPVRSILSAAVRVSGTTPALIIAGLAAPVSDGEIEAVTLLAYRPPRPARQKAASQTVLIISTLTSEARRYGPTNLSKGEIYQP